MYYIIKDGNQILHTGTAEPNTVGTRFELLWFDTEEEMLQYVADHGLATPKPQEDALDV